MSYAENILPDCEHVQRLRRDIIEKLGLIVLAEKMLPEVLTDGLYEATSDELRAVTEEGLGGDTLAG